MNMPAPSLGSTAASSAILPFILLAAVMIYTPGLSGPFFFDDIPHTQNNPRLRPDELNATTLKLAAFFTTHADSFQRPVSMASFAFNYYFFGEGPTSFKAVNLGIHLINHNYLASFGILSGIVTLLVLTLPQHSLCGTVDATQSA